MKFFRLDLLTLLISLFILGSCKNENTIGLPQGAQQLSGTLVVDSNIVVNTIAEDPISTTASTKTPLADFNDNIIGTTKTNIAAAVDLPGNTAYTLPTGTITTDSAVLELRYSDGFYGDSLTSKYKVSVYQLTERPLASQAYLSNRSWGDPNSLKLVGNTQAISVRPKTPVKITHILDGAVDTLHLVTPHIRVPIQTTFINNNLFGAPATQLASSSAFQNAFKGLFITMQREQSSEAGGTIMLNLDSCRIHVYYRANNSGTIDTAEAVLPFVAGAHAAEIKRTYTTAVQSVLNDTTKSNDVFYLQAGLRTRIKFPALESLFGTATASQIALNRAELVITPEPSTRVPFVPAPQLTMYRYDIAMQRQLLPDANGSSSGALDAYYFSTVIFGGRYDATTTQQYHFIVTGYIQKLLNKKLVDYGTYIAPIDTFSTSNAIPITSTNETAGRTIAVGSNKASPYKIKLNIIYTKTNQ